MLNARIPIDQLEKVCAVSVEGRRLLAEAIETLGFTARAYHRILRLSRTVSDLAGSDTVQAEHIAESLQFRFLDRASSWC
jgi:magnesium chelatase family protein|tara:strand:- start:457 stop:696 length:240 start_codon:yes stop_codon:yes gene_type:complete